MTMMPGMPWHSLFALRHSSRGHGYDMDIYIYIYIYIHIYDFDAYARKDNDVE